MSDSVVRSAAKSADEGNEGAQLFITMFADDVHLDLDQEYESWSALAEEAIKRQQELIDLDYYEYLDAAKLKGSE